MSGSSFAKSRRFGQRPLRSTTSESEMGKANLCLKRCLLVHCILFGIIGTLWLGILLLSHVVIKLKDPEWVGFSLREMCIYYVLGGIMMVVSFVGNWARKEKKWALILFFIGMLLICIFFLWMSVTAASEKSQMKSILDKKYELEVPLDMANQSIQDEVENIQYKLQCCGLLNGYQDWGETVPHSCLCPEHHPFNCIQVLGTFQVHSDHSPPGSESNITMYSEPCLPKVLIFMEKISVAAMGLALAIAVIALIGMALSMTLLYHIRRRPSTTAVTLSVDTSMTEYGEPSLKCL